jgi:hypothetical protein
MLRRLVVSTTLISILLAGCRKVYDRGQAEAMTRSNLRQWESYVTSLYEAGVPIDRYRTLDQAATLLEDSNAIGKNERNCLVKDGWQRDVRWTVTERDGQTIIRISSDGKNGIDEGGGGDDIFVEITLPPQPPER